MKEKDCIMIEIFVFIKNNLRKVFLNALGKSFVKKYVKLVVREKIKFNKVNKITNNNLLEV